MTEIRRGLAACAVALTCLVLAPAALAHTPVASATQTCNVETGEIEFSTTFDNPGFATTVTATDSQAGVIGGTAVPFAFSAAYSGPDRAAGTVTYDWASGNDSGSLSAPYEAVTGCEAPPPPTTTTTTTPPPPPPGHTHIGGPPATGSGHSSPPSSPSPAPVSAPPGVQGGELPFSGLSVGWLALGGVALLGGGLLLSRKLATD